MVNQIVLVGRIARTPETRITENGKKMATLTLAVPRNYKNSNGEYDTDFLDCTLWSAVAESTSEYCETGDMIGIKGYLKNQDGEIMTKTLKVININESPLATVFLDNPSSVESTPISNIVNGSLILLPVDAVSLLLVELFNNFFSLV